MQRRRKKKTTQQAKRNPAGIKLDKSLPAIPPGDERKEPSQPRDEAYGATSTETSRDRETDYAVREGGASDGSQRRQANNDQGESPTDLTNMKTRANSRPSRGSSVAFKHVSCS